MKNRGLHAIYLPQSPLHLGMAQLFPAKQSYLAASNIFLWLSCHHCVPNMAKPRDIHSTFPPLCHHRWLLSAHHLLSSVLGYHLFFSFVWPVCTGSFISWSFFCVTGSNTPFSLQHPCRFTHTVSFKDIQRTNFILFKSKCLLEVPKLENELPFITCDERQYVDRLT